MTVVAHLRINLSPRVATGARRGAAPDVVRPPRRVVYTDGRRPARLVAAPQRGSVGACGPVPVARSLGWLVLVGALAFLVVLGIGWSTGAASVPVPQHTVLVQVHQGETLWNMARRMVPSAPPAAVVDKIRELNGLDEDSALYPGELLRVPSGLSGTDEAKAGVVRR
jgi:hypothetical protein